jgi:hypothetical protein
MHWRYRSRSIAIGGICLMATLAAGERVHAQAMQVIGSNPTGSSSAGSNPAASNSASSNAAGFNPYDPQWALATPFGFSAGSNLAPGIGQQAYTMKLGSGTVGLFAATNNQDYGSRAIGSTGNFFDPLPFSPLAQRSNWFSGLGDSAWRSSFVGSFKSNPNDALLGGLYTTASFGVTSFKTGPAGLPGLTNFSGGNGNDAVAVSATAGVGVQITPQISIEGSVGFTQMPPSAFR